MGVSPIPSVSALAAPEVLSRPWLRLAGKIAPEVLQAPRTAGDPLAPGDWPDVHSRVVGYLERTIVGRPWADQLALAAAVLTARRCDVATVRYRIQEVHAGFQRLAPTLGLTTMADWHPERHLRAYLTAEVLPHDRLGRRHTFWKSYSSATRHLARWLAPPAMDPQTPRPRPVGAGRLGEPRPPPHRPLPRCNAGPTALPPARESGPRPAPARA
jgi:hypothetical protein